MSQIAEFFASNPELAGVLAALAVAQIRAMIPAQSLPVIDQIVGNWGSCKNAPKGSRANPKDEQKP